MIPTETNSVLPRDRLARYAPLIDFENWVPVEITQAPVGVYRRKFFERDGKQYVDLNFHKDVVPLVNVWAKNLRWQDWENASLVRA